MRLDDNHGPVHPTDDSGFLVGLAGLPPEEIRKAKILYIRNAISSYKAARKSTAAFRSISSGGLFRIFSLVPFMGSFERSQRELLQAGIDLARERIMNAIETWRDELRGERFDFGDGEVIEVK